MSTTATRPIKVAETAPRVVSDTRGDVNGLKSLETGRVTAVAAVMTIFKKISGSLRSTTNKGSYLAPNSKDLASKKTKSKLNSAKTRPARATKPRLGRSTGLVASKKAIRVLLDSGSSGDLLFTKKGASKYIHLVKRVTPCTWGTSNGTFATKQVGDRVIAFVDYSESKRVRLRPDVVEYGPGESIPLYDLIVGKETMHELGVVLDFKEKTIQIDKILLPMRNIMNLVGTSFLLREEPLSTCAW